MQYLVLFIAIFCIIKKQAQAEPPVPAELIEKRII